MLSPTIRPAAGAQSPAGLLLPEASGTEALLQADPRVWRAASLGQCQSPGLPSGYAELDAELPGGGWPTRALTEVLQAQAGLAEWRLLGPMLRPLLIQPPVVATGRSGRSRRRVAAPAASARTLLLINPPLMPHLPGLREHGIAARQLVWIAPQRQEQALWATEQAIKSNAAAAVLAWLPAARPEQVRRLQTAALSCSAPVFLFRPLAAASQSSAAPLRLQLAPGEDWALELQILKRRGPMHEQLLRLTALPNALQALLPSRLLLASSSSTPPPETGDGLAPSATSAARRPLLTTPPTALARPLAPALQ
ncbi:recombinase RecA [Pelomonas sp. SE-A7]|uniref:recombinase RecA n=1 Tax=Pelomonas sp. SE-A7 TaxID=3054953 RepID=UPI00259C7E83|nr:recombinase RecA [Pelomonas sp. SE-A7]MDM4766246.1 recombinase RecA [Pelomonas sp. SE-A7]